MSIRRACDDDEIKSFRHDLEALAAETRALTAPETFADALARRLEQWNVAPSGDPVDGDPVEEDVGNKRKRTEIDDLVRETDALEDELNRGEQGPGEATQLEEMQIVSGRRDDGLAEVRETTVALVREIIKALDASDDYGELKLLEETARANLSRIPGRSDVANTARKLLEKLIRQLTDKLSTRSPCFQRAETTVTSRCESLRCSAGAGSVARDA